MTTMTPPFSPATATPSLFKRFLNWIRGTKPVEVTNTELATDPVETPEEAASEHSDAPFTPPLEQQAKSVASSAIRKLMDTDHSGRGYHEGLSRGDKHFMELSIGSICSELQEAILDAINENKTHLAKLEQQRKKMEELELHDMALKFGPRMQRILKDIEVLQAQQPLVAQGIGWAYLPVTTYRNAFQKAQTEKAEQILHELTKPLL